MSNAATLELIQLLQRAVTVAMVVATECGSYQNAAQLELIQRQLLELMRRQLFELLGSLTRRNYVL